MWQGWSPWIQISGILRWSHNFRPFRRPRRSSPDPCQVNANSTPAGTSSARRARPVGLRDLDHFDILPASAEMLPNGGVHDGERVVFASLPVEDHDLHPGSEGRNGSERLARLPTSMILRCSAIPRPGIVRWIDLRKSDAKASVRTCFRILMRRLHQIWGRVTNSTRYSRRKILGNSHILAKSGSHFWCCTAKRQRQFVAEKDQRRIGVSGGGRCGVENGFFMVDAVMIEEEAVSAIERVEPKRDRKQILRPVIK